MRKVNKQEVVDRFRGQFLQGKKETFVTKFNNQPLEKQYGSISRWIKSNSINTAEEITPQYISQYIQRVNNFVARLNSLNEEQANVLCMHLDSAKESINNFAEIKRRQQIEALEAQRARIDAELNALINR